MENTWRGRVTGSTYIRRQTSRWVSHFIDPALSFPTRIFGRKLQVPRTLFYRLISDLRDYDVNSWTTKYDGKGRVGIHAAVTVLVCLKPLGTGPSLREREDRSQMGQETIRQYMMRILREKKNTYGATYLNKRPNRAKMGTIASLYAKEGFPGYIEGNLEILLRHIY